ncbi:hypothetical protein CPSG_04464 [Coccidioides posadasii str. Silveira]|uniref:Uncharacterized protein n=1 Tax=Coccidioides posadasii (strain RMSCC 757 / Silveira) TaxID=443226 RepID=E9D4C5_COCPS|nr:hypothetical protein CPSG_04464 [Coccidioides posadasii str. Silveira]
MQCQLALLTATQHLERSLLCGLLTGKGGLLRGTKLSYHAGYWGLIPAHPTSFGNGVPLCSSYNWKRENE